MMYNSKRKTRDPSFSGNVRRAKHIAYDIQTKWSEIMLDDISSAKENNRRTQRTELSITGTGTEKSFMEEYKEKGRRGQQACWCRISVVQPRDHEIENGKQKKGCNFMGEAGGPPGRSFRSNTPTERRHRTWDPM